MDWLLQPLSETQLLRWERLLDDWFFVFALGYELG
jgi:hypothetical protein